MYVSCYFKMIFWRFRCN